MKRLFRSSQRCCICCPKRFGRGGDDGLHKQPWFHQSFLELADDVQEAADEVNFWLS